MGFNVGKRIGKMKLVKVYRFGRKGEVKGKGK